MQPPRLILSWNGNLTGSRQIKILAAVKENKDVKTHFHIFPDSSLEIPDSSEAT